MAQILSNGGLGTLLFDLLTAEEEKEELLSGHLRFDIGVLAARTNEVTDWLIQGPQARITIDHFGSSTGAAAALVAAARQPEIVRVLVSRGGPPDLAGSALAEVEAPLRFVVGERDETVIGLNKWAMSQLKESLVKHLEIIPRAKHLCEEPGTLQRVAWKALHRFQAHLSRADGSPEYYVP